MAVDATKVYLPPASVPVVMPDGMINPAWYQALKALQDLANATKDEVDTQHP